MFAGTEIGWVACFLADSLLIIKHSERAVEYSKTFVENSLCLWVTSQKLRWPTGAFVASHASGTLPSLWLEHDLNLCSLSKQGSPEIQL
jgi:hypothetical protein